MHPPPIIKIFYGYISAQIACDKPNIQAYRIIRSRINDVQGGLDAISTDLRQNCWDFFEFTRIEQEAIAGINFIHTWFIASASRSYEGLLHWQSELVGTISTIHGVTWLFPLIFFVLLFSVIVPFLILMPFKHTITVSCYLFEIPRKSSLRFAFTF